MAYENSSFKGCQLMESSEYAPFPGSFITPVPVFEYLMPFVLDPVFYDYSRKPPDDPTMNSQNRAPNEAPEEVDPFELEEDSDFPPSSEELESSVEAEQAGAAPPPENEVIPNAAAAQFVPSLATLAQDVTNTFNLRNLRRSSYTGNLRTGRLQPLGNSARNLLIPIRASEYRTGDRREQMNSAIPAQYSPSRMPADQANSHPSIGMLAMPPHHPLFNESEDIFPMLHTRRTTYNTGPVNPIPMFALPNIPIARAAAPSWYDEDTDTDGEVDNAQEYLNNENVEEPVAPRQVFQRQPTRTNHQNRSWYSYIEDSDSDQTISDSDTTVPFVAVFTDRRQENRRRTAYNAATASRARSGRNTNAAVPRASRHGFNPILQRFGADSPESDSSTPSPATAVPNASGHSSAANLEAEEQINRVNQVLQQIRSVDLRSESTGIPLSPATANQGNDAATENQSQQEPLSEEQQEELILEQAVVSELMNWSDTLIQLYDFYLVVVDDEIDLNDFWRYAEN